MNLIKPVMAFMQLFLEFFLEIFSCTPVQVVGIAVFFYYGHHKYALEAIHMMIESFMHIVEVSVKVVLQSLQADLRHSTGINISKSLKPSLYSAL